MIKAKIPDSYPAILDGIRKLSIQGAETIAKAGLKALVLKLTPSTSDDEIKEICEEIFSTRPNEPMLINLIYLFLHEIRGKKLSGSILRSSYEKFLEKLGTDEEKIASYGANLIRSGMKVFTHCHSSSVMGILKNAFLSGKSFTLLNTETRPRYQGRKTAIELCEIGVPVIHYVDSAGYQALRESDLFLFGADVVLANNFIINKIGTAPLAILATKLEVPTYCVTHTLKADIKSVLGEDEDIENRSPEEVWKDAPEEITIKNPAFDKVNTRYIDGFITEMGIVKNLFELKSWDFC